MFRQVSLVKIFMADQTIDENQLEICCEECNSRLSWVQSPHDACHAV